MTSEGYYWLTKSSSRLFVFISFCHADDRKHLAFQEIFHSVQNDKESIYLKISLKLKSLNDFKYKLLLNDEGLWKITSPFYNAFILQI